MALANPIREAVTAGRFSYMVELVASQLSPASQVGAT